MTKGFIYKFLNTKNAMFYIGQTTVPEQRERSHFWMLKNGKHPSKQLQQAWNEQNGEGFVFQIMFEIQDATHALTLEQFVLNQMPDLCYNTSKFANAPHKGKFGADHPCGGKSPSPQLIEKRRQGVLAYWADKDHPSKGKPRNKEVKQKISEAQLDKVVSLETREKQRQIQLGRVWTEEEKQKLRKPKGRAREHADKFNKPIVEITTGRRFESLKAVKAHYSISPGFLAKALAKDAPLSKGRLAGLHFRYS